MTHENERLLAETAAAARALFASLIDPKSGFAQNAALGSSLYSAGGPASIWMVTQMAAIRLQLIDEIRVGEGQPPMAFPRDRLLAQLPPSSIVPDVVDVLTQLRAGQVLDMEPYERLNAKHGLLALMMMAQLANAVGRIFVDEVPGYEDLGDLLRKEAIADELDML